MNMWLTAIANLAAAPPPPLEPEKTCGRCKQTKAVSQFYTMGGRLSRSCKACHKAHIYCQRQTDQK